MKSGRQIGKESMTHPRFLTWVMLFTERGSHKRKAAANAFEGCVCVSVCVCVCVYAHMHSPDTPRVKGEHINI